MLRLRVSTMTPAIVPFNRRRKYPVHPGTTASGPARRGPCSSSMLRPASGPSCRNRANGGVSRRMRPQLRTGRSVSPEDGTRTGRPGAVPCRGWDRDALAEPRPPPSPTHRETPAGAGWMALDYGRNLGAEGGSWPGIGRADADIISGRVGSTKGRTRIFAGVINSQPSGHATVGQCAERRPMARSMAPPTGGHRRVAGLTRSGSFGRGYSRRQPGMRGRCPLFRRPTVPPWRFAPLALADGIGGATGGQGAVPAFGTSPLRRVALTVGPSPRWSEGDPQTRHLRTGE